MKEGHRAAPFTSLSRASSDGLDAAPSTKPHGEPSWAESYVKTKDSVAFSTSFFLAVSCTELVYQGRSIGEYPFLGEETALPVNGSVYSFVEKDITFVNVLNQMKLRG